MALARSRAIVGVYGEAAYQAARERTSPFREFEAIDLPTLEQRDADFDFADFPPECRGRPIVIWPGPGDNGVALAQQHAEALANNEIASAVGVVLPPPELDADFVFGKTPIEHDAWKHIVIAARVELADALARALPDQISDGGRAVAPWADELNTATMFANLRAFLSRYLAEPRTTLDLIALWCLHAWHAQDEWADATGVSPRLILQANDVRADHARALRLIAWLTPQPRIVSRAIAQHLLPMIGAERPTLLFDDVAGAILFRREMRALIAAGATRDSSFLIGHSKRSKTPWATCFAPAAIATTMRAPADMLQRAIVAAMSPVPAGATRERLIPGSPPDDVFALRAQMSAFAATLRDAPGDDDVALPAGLSAAARENWRPLAAVAAAIGGKAVAGLLDAALTLAEAEPAPASNLALLGDIRALVPISNPGVATAQLIERLVADAERPWGVIRRGGKIDPRELAERLRVFGLRPTNMRMGDETFARGYRAEDLADAFSRYLGPGGVTSSPDVAAA